MSQRCTQEGEKLALEEKPEMQEENINKANCKQTFTSQHSKIMSDPQNLKKRQT